MYYVYVHTVPNGKMYIGKAKDLNARWGLDGESYSPNEDFYKDIKEYGWENIKHEIIAEYPTDISASIMEAVLIVILGTEKAERGYNQTDYFDKAVSMYQSRVEVGDFKSAPYEQSDSFFEKYGLSTIEGRELIEKWIFSKQQREILIDRLLDDISYTDLSKKYDKSVRALKTIVREGCKKIERQL